MGIKSIHTFLSQALDATFPSDNSKISACAHPACTLQVLETGQGMCGLSQDGNSKDFDSIFPCFLLSVHRFSVFSRGWIGKVASRQENTSNTVKKHWKRIRSLLPWTWHGLKRFQQFLCFRKRNWKGVGIPLAEIPARFQFQEKKNSANSSNPKWHHSCLVECSWHTFQRLPRVPRNGIWERFPHFKRIVKRC